MYEELLGAWLGKKQVSVVRINGLNLEEMRGLSPGTEKLSQLSECP